MIPVPHPSKLNGHSATHFVLASFSLALPSLFAVFECCTHHRFWLSSHCTPSTADGVRSTECLSSPPTIHDSRHRISSLTLLGNGFRIRRYGRCTEQSGPGDGDDDSSRMPWWFFSCITLGLSSLVHEYESGRMAMHPMIPRALLPFGSPQPCTRFRWV